MTSSSLKWAIMHTAYYTDQIHSQLLFVIHWPIGRAIQIRTNLCTQQMSCHLSNEQSSTKSELMRLLSQIVPHAIGIYGDEVYLQRETNKLLISNFPAFLLYLCLLYKMMMMT